MVDAMVQYKPVRAHGFNSSDELRIVNLDAGRGKPVYIAGGNSKRPFVDPFQLKKAIACFADGSCVSGRFCTMNDNRERGAGGWLQHRLCRRLPGSKLGTDDPRR